MPDQEAITAHLRDIHQRIDNACRKSGRPNTDVRLLMATKTVDPDGIKLAIDAGERLIGENKVQEYAAKWEALKNENIERHFIGHLQTNKVKDVIKYVTCIESVDRIELAHKLHQKLEQANRTMDIYVEVNTSGEESKSGVEPDKALDLMEQITALKTLRLRGLMTIGLASEHEAEIRACFRRLVAVRDAAQKAGLLPSPCELSMGMSHDLEIAVEEGATIVRVGSAIFGSRNYGQ